VHTLEAILLLWLQKPSHVKVFNGDGDKHNAQVNALLSAIPAFDGIAGLCNRT